MRVHDGDPGDETDGRTQYRQCVICGDPLSDDEQGMICEDCQEDVREEES